MHHGENLFFFLVLDRTVLPQGPKLPYLSALWRENEHGDPHFLLLFYHLLDLLHQWTKFHLQSMLGSFTKESP